MSLDLITLQTNKSISVVNNNTRVIRQSEKGLVLPVILVNTNGSPYDLTGKSLVFSENKESDKIVIDDGTGDAAGKFQITDAKNGKFNYTLQEQVYAASGTAWFEIKSGDTVVDTTQNFKFKVLEEANINISNDDYVSSLKALQSHLEGTIQKAEASINETANKLTDTSDKAKQDAVSAINQAKNTALTTLNNLNSQYNSYLAKYQKLENDLKNQQTKIQNTADSQLASKLNKMQNDFNTWKSKTIADFNTSINSISKKLSDQHQDTADLKAYLDEIKEGIANAEKQFDKIDFTKYVTHDQFLEMKKTKASGLKVHGLGGDYIMAVNTTDSNIDATPGTSQSGLVDFSVLNGAIQVMANAILDQNHYTKAEVDKMKQDVINEVNKKVNQTDFNNLRNRTTALENANYVKGKLTGFKSNAEAAQWAKNNHGIAYFED